jgi:CHAT domain-containing protein
MTGSIFFCVTTFFDQMRRKHMIRNGFRYLLLGLLLAGMFASPATAACPEENTGKGEQTVKFLKDGALAGLKGTDRIKMLLHRGEKFERLGQYRDAGDYFQAALAEAQEQNTPVFEAMAVSALGYTMFLQNDPVRAEALLRSALEQAKALNRPLLIANSANRLAALLAGKGERSQAEGFYRQALAQADKANDLGLQAAIHRNLAQVMLDDAAALATLRTAQQKAAGIASAQEQTEILLGIAAEAKKRGSGNTVLALRYETLVTAYRQTAGTEALRLHSLAAGELGALYEEQGRVSEAQNLTEQAQAAAQALRSDELLLRWEWQLGRLLYGQGKLQGALAAYRRAVDHIEVIRQDLPITYQDGRSSFREMLAPIYFGLADMLLQQSSLEQGEAAAQILLREARDTVERIKRSEMQDYFRDRCIASRSRDIESFSATTAVLYPIVLPERLELLVDISGHIYRQSVVVPKKELEEVTTRLAHNMRGNLFYEEPAKQIHAWLIKPVLPLLEEHTIDTLVFAPDGVLRLLPIAALWDGQRFLVERFALVTTPGLTLLDPGPLLRGEMKALLAGMSNPGPVVEDLPPNLLRGLRQAASRQLARGGTRGLSVEMGDLEVPASAGGAAPSPEGGMEGVRQMLALPGVDKEIEDLSRQLPAQVLLNEDFQLQRFSSELESQPFQVVHIASHGYFGGAPEQNFIMTYDRRLSMNELEALIKPKQFAEHPVD